MGILRNYTHCENGNKSNQAPREAAQRRPRLFITTGMIVRLFSLRLVKRRKKSDYPFLSFVKKLWASNRNSAAKSCFNKISRDSLKRKENMRNEVQWHNLLSGFTIVILGLCICSYPVILKIHSMTPIVTRIYPLVPYLHVCLYRTRVGEKKIVQFISTF